MGTIPLVARRDKIGQKLHDTVVELLARHWQNPTKYNITTNPGSEKNRWVSSDENYPDLVCWVRNLDREKAVWIAEVETSGSVTENEAREQWTKYDSTGVPFYLVVPAGCSTTARALAARLKLAINGVYEFSFLVGQFILKKM